MMIKDDFRWDFQIFSDEPVDIEPTPEGEPVDGDPAQAGDPADSDPAEPKPAQEKKYTDAEVDAILNRKFAKWQKAQDKAVADARAEAEKVAKMNSEQKRQYEAEKKDQLIKDQQAEIDRLKQDALRSELSKSAARIMKDDYQIIATQDMLDFAVGADAESTTANIAKLVGIIMDDRKLQEEKRARGTVPKAYRTDGGEQESEIKKRIAAIKKRN